MSVDKTTVARVAHLARLAVPEDRLEPLAAELSGILDWIEQLSQVDTENVPPLTSVADITLPRRADEVTVGNQQFEVLDNTPETEQGYYVVPKVIE